MCTINKNKCKSCTYVCKKITIVVSAYVHLTCRKDRLGDSPSLSFLKMRRMRWSDLGQSPFPRARGGEGTLRPWAATCHKFTTKPWGRLWATTFHFFGLWSEIRSKSRIATTCRIVMKLRCRTISPSKFFSDCSAAIQKNVGCRNPNKHGCENRIVGAAIRKTFCTENTINSLDQDQWCSSNQQVKPASCGPKSEILGQILKRETKRIQKSQTKGFECVKFGHKIALLGFWPGKCVEWC